MPKVRILTMRVVWAFWLVLVGLLWAGMAEAACGGSSPTLTAASPAYTDVSDCYTAAIAGDTIVVPVGSASWSSLLTITKAVTIQGQSIADLVSTGVTAACNASTSTCITSTRSNGTELFKVAPTSDLAIRITGLDVLLNSGAATNNGQKLILVENASVAFPLTQIRIDHNTLRGGGSTMHSSGWLEILYDHNRCENQYSPWIVQDRKDVTANHFGTVAWTRMYTTYGSGGVAAVGTQHAVFIEANMIVHTGSGSLDVDVYSQDGGSIVFRYNTVHETTHSGAYRVVGDHGNFTTYCTTGGAFCQRGIPVHEDYNNELNLSGANIVDEARGGSHLFHNNTITTGATFAIQLWEEELWLGHFSPLRTVWPAQDAIINSFYWGNTFNGSPQNSGFVENDTESAGFFVVERDFYLHAPEATGGKCSYDSTPGLVGAYPGGNDGGGITCSGTGANAYYPYTPYTYPHPLQGSDTTQPAAPTGVTISRPVAPMNLHFTGGR